MGRKVQLSKLIFLSQTKISKVIESGRSTLGVAMIVEEEGGNVLVMRVSVTEQDESQSTL